MGNIAPLYYSNWCASSQMKGCAPSPIKGLREKIAKQMNTEPQRHAAHVTNRSHAHRTRKGTFSLQAALHVGLVHRKLRGLWTETRILLQIYILEARNEQGETSRGVIVDLPAVPSNIPLSPP